MKNSKSLAILSVIVILLSFCFSQNIFAAETTEKLAQRNSEAVEFLQSVGAIEGDWSAMELTATVKRSDAAQYLAVLLKDGMLLEANTDPAEDVKLNKDYAKAVYNMILQGIIPTENGKFKPSDYFTFSDMRYALCKMLGYTEYIETLGLDENQINILVSDAGIFQGVAYKENSPMTKAEFAVILKEALMAKMLDKEITGDDVYFKSDVPMLERYLSVEVHRGIIKANKYTSIADMEGLGVDEVLLDDMRCSVGTTNAADYIGCKVEAYVKADKDTDINTILRIDYRNCKVLVIDCEDINFNNSQFSVENISYIDDKGRDRQAKVSPTADFFYNNRVCVPDEADFQINNGTVTLISNENNNMYDVVKIKSYENYVVDYVDTKNAIVYDKILDASGNQRTLDLSADDKVLLSLCRVNGRDMNVSDLKRGNVISVYKSKDGGYVDAVVSTDVAEGMITYIDPSDVRTVIHIDDAEYKFFMLGQDWGVNSNLYPKFGVGGIFYLDANGFIAYAEYTSGVGLQYGFVTGTEMDVFGQEAFICIIDEDGLERVLSIPEKGIKINDYANNVSTKTSPEDVCAMFSNNHQLVQFQATSGGKIIKLNVAEPLASGEMYNTDEFTLAVDFGESECTYKYAANAFVKSAGSSTVNAAIGNNTKVFVIDSVESSKLAGKNDVHVYTSSQINKQVTVKDVKYYDVDKTLTAKVLVYVLTDTVTQEQGMLQNICIFDSVRECWDSETGETYKELSVYRKGQEESYRIAENYSMPVCSKGDMLAVYQNFYKEISKVYNIKEEIGNGYEFVLHGSEVYTSRAYFGKAHLMGASNERMAIFRDDLSSTQSLYLNSPTIYEITQEGGRAEVNTKASLSMVPETLTPQEGSLIYFFANEGKVYDIVIYR